MIRFYLISLFLIIFTSCSINILDSNNINTLKLLRDSFIQNNKTISMQEIEDYDYSFAIVDIQNDRSIYSLIKIKNSQFIWKGPDNEILVTLNGKIIGAYGVYNQNITYLDLNNFENTSIKKNKNLLKIGESLIRVNSLVEYDGSYRLEYSEDNLITLQAYKEEIFSEPAFWKATNYYYFRDKEIMKTIQSIDPNDKPIEITFYLKKK